MSIQDGADRKYRPVGGSKRMPRVPRLLLVEDNPADAFLFQEQLELVDDFRCLLDRVDSLVSAVAAVKAQRYDCIILDLNLPDSQGISSYKILRDNAPNTAIVILTGESDRFMMARALTEGADSYLLKGACDGNRIALAVISAMRNHSDEEQRTEWVLINDTQQGNSSA